MSEKKDFMVIESLHTGNTYRCVETYSGDLWALRDDSGVHMHPFRIENTDDFLIDIDTIQTQEVPVYGQKKS